MCVWDGDVIHGELGCVAMFWGVAGEECCCGFCWGYFKSVFGEPIVESVKVGLEQLSCGVCVWMGACESDIVCIGGYLNLGCGGCG